MKEGAHLVHKCHGKQVTYSPPFMSKLAIYTSCTSIISRFTLCLSAFSSTEKTLSSCSCKTQIQMKVKAFAWKLSNACTGTSSSIFYVRSALCLWDHGIILNFANMLKKSNNKHICFGNGDFCCFRSQRLSFTSKIFPVIV